MISSRTTTTFVFPGIVLAMLFLSAVFLLLRERRSDGAIGMAVEFTNHAAAAYVAQDKGWYEARGLRLSSHQSYVTGMALASALARGDIQVAYICLIPAISAYANAGVPIKIVAGTHKYGYALVANPDVVAAVEDLSSADVRTGCVREGGAVDVLLNRTIDAYGLDRAQVLSGVRRMNPPKLLLAIQMGRLDAAFLPEHWAAMAEDLGFRTLLAAQDVWPGMLGSVLVVKEELVRERPDLVRSLVAVNEDATRWIDDHPEDAAATLAAALSVTGGTVLPAEAAGLASQLDISPATMLRSMARLEYSSDISLAAVQEAIDYAALLGYIGESFPAEEIVDLRFLR